MDVKRTGFMGETPSVVYGKHVITRDVQVRIVDTTQLLYPITHWLVVCGHCGRAQYRIHSPCAWWPVRFMKVFRSMVIRFSRTHESWSIKIVTETISTNTIILMSKFVKRPKPVRNSYASALYRWIIKVGIFFFFL